MARHRVRPGASGGGYTLLTPRQPITPAPYAIYAATAPVADNAVTSVNIANGAITGADVANNTIGSAQLADNIDLGTSGIDGLLTSIRRVGHPGNYTERWLQHHQHIWR